MNLKKLEKIEQRYSELEKQLGDPDIIADQAKYQKLAKEFSDSTPAVEALRAYRKNVHQIDELKNLLLEKHDKEFEDLAKSELNELKVKNTEIAARIEEILSPKSTEKDRDIIMEIRAGTGGQEASLFAADLYRMYLKYAEQNRWKVESISSSPSETGGFKEVIFSMRGKGASKRLKWESGVHRVQRVPVTETSGRIHTSAATVAVLFEPEEIEVNIDPKDLKVDVFRSSGPGGQSVNTTDSAIRVTHLPSGIVVICQDERSQLKNKYKAMRVLRARLNDKIQRENIERETKDRKAKVGSGDRSEKIRTYNYPDRRVTDHRIGFTIHKLPNIMDGDLNDITDALLEAEAEAELEAGQ
jgi:peptide chain release factor 1